MIDTQSWFLWVVPLLQSLEPCWQWFAQHPMMSSLVVLGVSTMTTLYLIMSVLDNECDLESVYECGKQTNTPS